MPFDHKPYFDRMRAAWASGNIQAATEALADGINAEIDEEIMTELNRLPEHPSELTWTEEPLPGPEEVPYDCRVLAWMVSEYREEDRRLWDHPMDWPDGKVEPEKYEGKLRRVTTILPWGDNLNPVRWTDTAYHSIGWCEKVKYWAWVSRGTPGKKCPYEYRYAAAEPEGM